MIQSTTTTIPVPPDLVLFASTEENVTSICMQKVGSHEISSISVSELTPLLGNDCVAQHVLALDVLESVLDEEAWLSAIATTLAPGGWLTLRVPLEGPAAWLDALNLFRYTQDVSGLGTPPQETRQKDWHRHYRVSEIPLLLERSGLVVQSMTREGSPHSEVKQLSGLLWGTIVRGDNTTESRIRGQQQGQEYLRLLPKLGPLSTHLTVVARKPL